jgi:antirestriction protein ArdC
MVNPVRLHAFAKNAIIKMNTITKKEALQLGIIGADGLGFVKPQTAYRNINEKILAEIKKGNLVWRKGWRDGVVVKGVSYGPQNYETQRPYSGGNAFYISMVNMMSGTDYQYFLTKKQILDRGAKLKKDAVAFPVSILITGEKTREIKRGEKVLTLTEDYKGVVWYYVYPIDHVEDLVPIKRKTKKPDAWAELVVPDAEMIVKNMPKAPPIDHGGDRAFYRPSTDSVQMPLKKAFKVQQEYYSVLFHELIHSTGHKSRLNRDMSGAFGSKPYAFEELIAELGAAYLCAVCEIDYYTVDNSAAYLKSWSKRLVEEIEADPEFLKRAVFKAAKASSFIIGHTLENEGKERPAETTKEEHFPGAEVKPNKKVKASVAAAITDVLSLAQYKDLKPMFVSMLYRDFKDEDVIFGGHVVDMKLAIYEKNEGKYLQESATTTDWEITPDGRELIDKIKGRLHTLKAKKGGQDLFPDLAGPKEAITDSIVIFLNAMLQSHNRTVTREELLYLIEDLRNASNAGLIAVKHPLKAIAKNLQAKVVKLINMLEPGESKTIQLTNKKKIEDRIQALHGLGFWNVIASAVVGKGAELLASKHIFKKPSATANGLNGLEADPSSEERPVQSKVQKERQVDDQPEGFIRADDRKEIKAPESFTLPTPIGKILGKIQPFKYAIVLTGDPHAGKTEVVCQLIDGFAAIGKKVGAYMLEQGGMESDNTKEAIDRNVSKERQKLVLVTGEAAKGFDTIKEQAKYFDVIVVDSWQKLGVPSTRFDELRHEFPEKIWITIFQQNGQGGTRGGVSADYDTPVHLKVHKVDETFKNNFVEVKKNRGNGNTLSLKYLVKAKKTTSI